MIDLTLDWETHYSDEYSLRKMTTAEYIRHPDFKVHMCGFKVGDAPAKVLYPGQIEPFLASIPWDQTRVFGHNLMFDGAVLQWHYGHRPAQYVDTLGMARAIIGTKIARHGLHNVAQHLGLGGKVGYDHGEAQALAAVKGNKTPSHAELLALAYYCAGAPNSDVELTWQVFQRLAPEFPEAEYEVLDWTIRMFTEPRLQLNTKRLELYEAVVRTSKEKQVADTGYPKGYFTSNDKFAALLKMHNVTPPKKFSKTTGKSTYAFSKNDLDFVELMEGHPSHIVRDLCETRVSVKSSIEETRARTLHRLSKTGYMPAPLMYSGALNTHRLSGGDGYNLQNLKRGGELRNCIEAPTSEMLDEEWVILVADSSNIELRVGFGLANDVERIQQFRHKQDLYCHTAGGIYGCDVPPPKLNGAENPAHTEAHAEMRQVGKVADLSLQYAAGKVAFQGMLRAMAKKLWELDRCQDIVTRWRATHQHTVGRWDDLSKALRMMSKGYTPNNWGITTNDMKPVFWFEPGALLLPNGLRIKYPDLQYIDVEERVGDKVEIKKKLAYRDERMGGWSYIYGGKVLENACQALARIIVIEQTMAINRIWPVSLSVHDEVVLCGPRSQMEALKPFVIMIMKESPSWWCDLPLDCSASIGTTYGDAK